MTVPSVPATSALAGAVWASVAVLSEPASSMAPSGSSGGARLLQKQELLTLAG
ncbi:MAG: hypothetical protein V9G22_01810 [Ottowia sp.]